MWARSLGREHLAISRAKDRDVLAESREAASFAWRNCAEWTQFHFKHGLCHDSTGSTDAN